MHALKLLHHVLNSLQQTIGACPAAVAEEAGTTTVVAAAAAALHYTDKKFKTLRLYCNNFTRETHSIISASRAKCMRREAVRANTAQLVPSSLNFHKFFALAPVPLTGCTGANAI